MTGRIRALSIVGCLIIGASAAAHGTATGRVVAWGCGGHRQDTGQCRVPAAAKSGVIAIAAGYAHSLALKRDGSVVAWGCTRLAGANVGQCDAPPASTVSAIAASSLSFAIVPRG